MSLEIANDQRRDSSLKYAAGFFAIAALMSVTSPALNDGRVSRWYYWYAAFFCVLWTFIGYRVKPRSYPVGESRAAAIRGAVPEAVVTGVSIGLLYWLGRSMIYVLWIGVNLGVLTGVLSYMSRRGFKPGGWKSLCIPPAAAFVVTIGVSVISIVFFR